MSIGFGWKSVYNQSTILSYTIDFHSMMRQSICMMRIYGYEVRTI